MHQPKGRLSLACGAEARGAAGAAGREDADDADELAWASCCDDADEPPWANGLDDADEPPSHTAFMRFVTGWPWVLPGAVFEIAAK